MVEAGSVLEDDDQLGLAHFTEHMAFNGTEHFAHNELVEFIEASGMSFGAHLNAYTSHDQTVYQLMVPTDDAQLFDQAFVVLSDFASSLSFDPEEIEKERGVVLEEWRQGRGVDGRRQDFIGPLLYAGSRYADRRPIGTEQSVAGFEHEVLVRFYEDWYRPDLMAVVAVGDFEVAEVERRIHATFADLQGPPEPRERMAYDLPPHDEVLFGVFTDPELTGSSATVMVKRDHAYHDTHADYREVLLDSVVSHVLNHRLGRLSREADPPFLGAGAGSMRLNATEVMVGAGCATREGQVGRGLEALLVELRRLAELGVTQAEVDWAVSDILASYAQSLSEVEATHSREHAEELVRHFTTAEPMPGMEYEAQLAQATLTGLRAEEVSAFAAGWLDSEGTVVVAELPDKQGQEPVTEDDLRATWHAAAKAELSPLEQTAEGLALVDEVPEPGTVVERREVPELGSVVWTLSNGATVWVKPTAFKDNEVRFSAFSPGGTSRVPDEDYIPASTALTIAGRSGLGSLDLDQLMAAMAGRNAGVAPLLDTHFEGFDGGAVTDDLETVLQLVHLWFTEPRLDAPALDLVRLGLAQYLDNRLSDPEAVFEDAHTSLMWGDHLRHRPWTVHTLDQLDLDRSEAVLEERFSDAGDFRFFFVGNVEPDLLEPLVNTWLGSLPTEGTRETPGDTGARRVEGVHQTTVRAGLEPKARVRTTWHGPFESTWLNRNRLLALGDILEVLLREELREERGGTYQASVSTSSWELPEHGYALTIDFQCDPDRVDELREATEGVVQRLVEEGVDEEYVEREQAMNRRGRETALEDNGFWLGGISGAIWRGEDPLDLLTWDERNDSLTAAEVHAAAQRLLRPTNRITTVLLPEAEPGSTAVPTNTSDED